MNYKVSVLVFIRNTEGKFLLLQRRRAPNEGCWTPIGGKLEMSIGESPYECAVRETWEEVGMQIEVEDLHLFGMIAEKAYEGKNHWLLFLFNCHKEIDFLPEDMDEGEFGLFERKEIENLKIAQTDQKALWKMFDDYHEGFVAARADCNPLKELEIVVEEVH